MKMILKHVLKPICESITSYQVKNVVFWVSETRQMVKENDIENDFNEILLEAINFLKDCIKAKKLGHYFIPSRNLMHVNISNEERSCLIESLTEISRDPTSALQRCPLIRKICNSPLKEQQEGLIFRNMMDEILAAIFAIEPEQYDDIEHLLHGTQSPEEYFELYMKLVPPILKKNNPYGYFHLILSKGNDDIKEILKEGCKKGYHELWIK
jgi:hypothetical protein